MPSVTEQIVASALTALNTGAPSGVPPVTRTRFEAYGAEELPAATIKKLREEVNFEKGGKWGPLRYRVLTLRLTVYALGDESAIDPVEVWATSVLDGQAFSPLIEVCIEGQKEYHFANEDQRYCQLDLDFRVHYHTVVGDLTAAQ